jgi:hypothetical protein
MLGIGWGYLYMVDALEDELWKTGLLWFLAAIAMWLYALADSAVGGSAFRYHLWVFGGAVPLELILLDAGTRLAIAGLGGKGMLVSGVVVVGLIAIGWTEAKSTRKRLVESREFSHRSLLDPQRPPGWDPSAAAAFLRTRGGKTTPSVRLWRLISPLLPAVGFALSRNLPNDLVPLLGCYLVFLLALMFAYGYAFQLGIALHIRSLEAALQTQLR